MSVPRAAPQAAPGLSELCSPGTPKLGEVNGDVSAHPAGCFTDGDIKHISQGRSRLDMRKDFEAPWCLVPGPGRARRHFGSIWAHAVPPALLRDPPEDPCRCLPPIYFSEKPWLIEAGGTRS